MFERLKWRIATLLTGGFSELPEGGRSSVEGTLADQIGGALSFYGSVSPVIDFEMLRCLKHLWIHNPDFSQFVANVVNLANTGHKLVVDAPTAQRAEAAAARLNEAASRLYDLGAGVDGLVNDELAQIAWSGALSSEDVVDLAGRRVERVVLVPVEQIRFRLIEGKYVPHQQPTSMLGLQRSALGLIPLNEHTYHYYAHQRVENSPYAKPIATAAVGAITGPQKDMLDNFKYVAQKFGLLGLISYACTPPTKKPGQSEAEFRTDRRTYLKAVGETIKPFLKDGLLVHWNDQKVTASSVTGDARGFDALFSLNEQQAISGFNGFPAFFGRTDSTTETYAWVVYQFMQAQAAGVQRLVKRRREATYRLDLRLGGVEVGGVSFQFNRAHALKPLEEAQAAEINERRALTKARAGIISPDQAAQEMGYGSAFDPELLSDNPELAGSLRRMGVGAGRESFSATFHFDRGAQKYRHIPQRVELSGAPVEVDTYVPVHKFALKKKAA
ncbi:MAG TPA: hypothetical protein VF659_09330 [Pyrinomonadaceae bacterium]|jgi:hypothetical protein